MQRIQVLDEQIANLIAAGEVIERPASVVKELAENSLDAGSTQIEVRVVQGGLQRIMIRDNGSGMHSDDCALAFQRHATSKIRNSRDLFRILSLGFRGEALPSIASVAKVECISCTDDSAQATLVRIHGGQLQTVETAGAPKGTTMDIKDLFYNTPARLKYMKSVPTEFGQIADVIQRLALARPDVAFSLYHDDHLILRTSGRNDVQEVIAAVYSKDTAKSLLPVRFQSADVMIQGFITQPSVTRSNRHAMTWLVNGRYIRSTLLNQAMMDGFHTLLPLHRYPVSVMHLTMDAQLLDVNVHPAKWDVRFSKEAAVREAVQKAVASALAGRSHIPDAGMPSAGLQTDRPEAEHTGPAGRSSQGGERKPEPERSFSGGGGAAAGDGSFAWSKPSSARFSESSAAAAYPAAGRNAYEPSQIKMEQWEQILTAERSADRADAPPSLQANVSADPSDSADERVSAGRTEDGNGQSASSSHAGMPSMLPVGQAHGTYIIAQDDESIYLIDQHAAHERINYEKYYKMFSRTDPMVQQLLVPLPFEMAADESAWLSGILPQLEAVGIGIEPFGQNSFVLRTHPEWFPPERAGELARDVIDWLLVQKKTFSLARLRDYAAKMCACKASVRANERLTTVQMQTLLDRLRSCEQPYTCPHGRPVIVRFGAYDLEKMFKRVM